MIALTSIILGFFWTPYFTYHIGLIAVTCLVLYVIHEYKKTSRLPLRVILPALVTLLVSAAIYVVVGKSSQFSEVPLRSMQEIYDQSLHPAMLLTPGNFSWLGQPIYHWVAAHISRVAYTNLYLGISVFKRKLPTNESQLVIAFTSIFLVTFLFSLAPTISIHGLNIPTPNYLIANVVPSLRAGQRLVGVMMICIAILAGIGIKYLPSYIARKYAMFVFIGICVVVALDILAIPPQLTSPAIKSQAIASLAKQPSGLVAEYISGSLVGDPSQVPCKNYLVHKMPIMNYCGMDIFAPPHTLQTIWRLAAKPKEDQPSLLRDKYGVRYVIIETNDSSTSSVYNESRSGYHLLTQDSQFKIYERAS